MRLLTGHNLGGQLYRLREACRPESGTIDLLGYIPLNATHESDSLVVVISVPKVMNIDKNILYQCRGIYYISAEVNTGVI